MGTKVYVCVIHMYGVMGTCGSPGILYISFLFIGRSVFEFIIFSSASILLAEITVRCGLAPASVRPASVRQVNYL